MEFEQLVPVNLDDNTLTVPWDGTPYDDWFGACLAVARSVPRFPADKYTAWEEWEVTDGKHFDRAFPIGVAVPVWFEHYGTYYDARKGANWYGNWGHVVWHRDGTFYSSPISHKPYFDKWTSIDQIEQKYKAKFVGWSEFIGDRQVVKQKEQDMLTDQGAAVLYRFRLGSEVTDYGKKNRIGKQTFDQADAEIRASKEYKQIVADTKAGKYNPLKNLPEDIRKAISGSI